jgi:hypothetical protein
MTDRVKQYKTTSGILFSESVAPSATLPVEVLSLLDFAVRNMVDDAAFLNPATNISSKGSSNQDVAQIPESLYNEENQWSSDHCKNKP